MAFRAEVVLFNDKGNVILRVGDTVKVHTKNGVSIEGRIIDLEYGRIDFGLGIGVDIEDVESIGLAISPIDLEN